MSKLTIFTAVHNEAPYIVDWVAHHLSIGVDTIVVYSAYPTDGCDEILDILAANGYLRHERLNNISPSPFAVAQKLFWESLEKEEAKWILPLDVREFLNIKFGDHTVHDLLRPVSSDVDAFVFPILTFGANSQIEIEGKSILDTHIMCGGYNTQVPIEASFGKNMIQNKQYFTGLNFYKGKVANNARPARILAPDVGMMPSSYSDHEYALSIANEYSKVETASIHYYPLRSAQDFLLNSFYEGPQHRRRPATIGFWIGNNTNNIKDDSINSHRNTRQKIKREIFELPSIRDLQREAVVKHRKNVELAIYDENDVELYLQLTMSTNSSRAPSDLGRSLNALYRELKKSKFIEDQKRLEERREKRKKQRARKKVKQLPTPDED